MHAEFSVLQSWTTKLYAHVKTHAPKLPQVGCHACQECLVKVTECSATTLLATTKQLEAKGDVDIRH